MVTTMKNKKRLRIIIIAVMTLMLAFVLAINYSVSYLVSTDNAENVFGVGNVQLRLDEDHFPTDDSSRKMVPKSIIPKDPSVMNTGSSSEYVFLVVTVPLEEVQIVDMDTDKINSSGKDLREIFNLLSNSSGAVSGSSVADFTKGFTKTDVGDFRFDPDWKFLTCFDTDVSHTYVFGYSSVLQSQQKTTALFDKIQLRNILEGEIAANAVESISLKAYGIQSEDYINDISVADPGNATVEELRAIYEICRNQEGL